MYAYIPLEYVHEVVYLHAYILHTYRSALWVRREA